MMSFSAPARRATPSVAVVGNGLIGLACATELADRGHRVSLIGRRLPGDASRAAAGLLAPSLESHPGPATDLGRVARDLYPEWLESLEARTGLHIPLNRRGIIHILDRSGPEYPEPLAPAAVRQLEPDLATDLPAVLHPQDGCVDNVALLHALDRVARGHEGIVPVDGFARRVEPRPSGAWRILDEGGGTHETELVVLAAGAWTAELHGLPRHIPVEPVRGQMIGFQATPVTHAVYGPGCYLVPRGSELLVGSTMERTGFDITTTADAGARLATAATALCPALSTLSASRRWAGLRPVTPDMLPILGPDIDAPNLFYATGHSRNGILLARVTALIVASLVAGDAPAWDISPFSIERFGREGPRL